MWRVKPEQPVLQGQWDSLDLRAQQERTAQTEQTAQTEPTVLPGLMEITAPTAQRDRKVSWGTPARWARLDHKGCLARRASLDPRELLEKLARRGSPV